MLAIVFLECEIREIHEICKLFLRISISKHNFVFVIKVTRVLTKSLK